MRIPLSRCARAAATAAMLLTLSGDPRIPVAASAASAEMTVAVVQTARLSTAEAVRTMRLVNYYPAEHAWAQMWRNFDPDRIRRDLAVVRRLGATTVRVIVPPHVFGFPQPQPVPVQQLQQTLQLARDAGLDVQLTLYDFWADWTAIAQSRRWTGALLSALDLSAVRVLELRNELDPTNPAATAWLRDQLRTVRGFAPGVPLTASTVSRRGLDGVLQLRSALGPDRLDLYSLHFYGSPTLAFDLFARARAVLAPVPVTVGEAGLPSRWAVETTGRPTSGESDQELWFRVVSAAAADAGLPPVAPWTLTDFTVDAIPFAVPEYEYAFGLYRTDGTAKPAAAVIRAAFTGRLRASGCPNRGFARGVDDGRYPALWPRWRSARDRRLVPGPAGRRAVRVSGTVTDPARAAGYSTIVDRRVRPGQVWTFTVLARGRGRLGRGWAAIGWYDRRDHWLGAARTPTVRPGQSWQRLRVVARPPRGAVSARVFLLSSGTRGAIRFADACWTVRGRQP